MLVSAFAKDGGMTMMEALNYAQLDYVSLGNHECLDLVKLNDAEFWNEILIVEWIHLVYS